MFLQSMECRANVYFRLCLSNKASWSVQQSNFVAMLHGNLLRVKHYAENEPGVNEFVYD